MKYFKIILTASAPGLHCAENPDLDEVLGIVAAPSREEAEQKINFKSDSEAPAFLRWLATDGWGKQMEDPKIYLSEIPIFECEEDLRRAYPQPKKDRSR